MGESLLRSQTWFARWYDGEGHRKQDATKTAKRVGGRRFLSEREAEAVKVRAGRALFDRSANVDAGELFPTLTRRYCDHDVRRTFWDGLRGWDSPAPAGRARRWSRSMGPKRDQGRRTGPKTGPNPDRAPGAGQKKARNPLQGAGFWRVTPPGLEPGISA